MQWQHVDEYTQVYREQAVPKRTVSSRQQFTVSYAADRERALKGVELNLNAVR